MRLTALLPLWPARLAAPRRSEGSRAARYRAPQAELRATHRLGRRFRPSERRASLPLARSVAPALPVLANGPPGRQDRCLRSSRQRGRRTSIQRAFPPPMGAVHACLRRRFGAARRFPAIDTIHERDRVDLIEPAPGTREVALARSGYGGGALASTTGRRFSVQGAGSGSRRIGLVQAMPGGATPKPIPAEHLASWARPAAGWRSRPRAASPPLERAHPRAPLARASRRHATRRLRGRSGSRLSPRPDHVTEGRSPCRPREGETRLAAPEVPSGR